MLRHEDRRDRIARELESHARRLNGRVHLKEHSTLIDEVADLVEFPGVVAGFFDRGFLALPQEVLTTTLVHHQHYFPVVTATGELKEAFLAVVNTQPADERLIAKNAERVVTARLRDAKFFWESDQKTPLEARLDRLHTLLFHKKLGSYRDKAQRISLLAERIAGDVLGSATDAAYAATAGRLAKADLTTEMVFEFTELQGTIGGIYARQQRQPEQVWKAIYYQYLPVGVEPDAPPSREQLGAAAVSWAAVSLADKLDSVLGLYAAGERPTGSRDPFAIRRSGQGAVRVLMDLPELTGINREISLSQLATRAYEPHAQLASDANVTALADAFWRERVRFALEQRGFGIEVVRAAISAGDVNPLRARRMAEAIQGMRGSEDFQALAVLFKRVKNIAKELGGDIALDRDAITEPTERALLDQLEARRPRIEAAAARSDYRGAFVEIGGLRAAVDRFFTEVFVMADDVRIRNARLKLMADLRDLILHLADISEIIPQTE